MKSVFAFALVSVLCTSAFADNRAFVNQAAMARPQVRNILAAGLTSFNIDARAEFKGANSGSVIVDLSGRTITMNFLRRPVCPVGSMCPQFIQNMGQIELPLVSRKLDVCGGTVYTAVRDDRRTDGGLQQLTVTDNTNNHCKTLVALAPTHIVLQEVGARASFNEQIVSTFEAAKLQQTMTAVPFNGQPGFAQ